MRGRRHIEPWTMYHVYSRGAARQIIFPSDADRLFFLEKLASLVEETGFEVSLLCLMDNHFHLCIRTSEESLSRFMQRLQTAYAVYFNRRYDRTGHVIQGRFRAKPVLGSRQLLQLSRYIHLNPVSTKAAESMTLKQKLAVLRAYPWSSYRGYLGLSTRHPFMEYTRVMNFFENRGEAPTQRYQRFVENGLRYSREHLRKFITNPGFTLTQKSEDALLERGTSKTVISPSVIIERCAQHFGIRPVCLTEPQYYVAERTMTAKLMLELTALNQHETALRLGWKSNAALSIQLRNFRTRVLNRPEVKERYHQLREAVLRDEN